MNLSKSTVILSILTLFLLVSVLSVSAADIDNNNNITISDSYNNNLKSDVDNLNFNNDINNLQDNANDENSDVKLTDDSNSVDENENCLKSNSTASEGGQHEKVQVDADNVIHQMMNSSIKKINQTSENTFEITLSDNSKMNVIRLNVYDNKSFESAMNFISSGHILISPESNSTYNILKPVKTPYDTVLIDFKENTEINICSEWGEYLANIYPCYTQIIFRGHGSKISGGNSYYTKQGTSIFQTTSNIHFMRINKDIEVTLEDLDIYGFSGAIENYGTLFCKNVRFDSNGYVITRKETNIISDNKIIKNIKSKFGGAIFNSALLECVNCKFTNNKAYGYGGAVYNCDFTTSLFIGCKFQNNTANKKTKSSYRIHDSYNIFSGKGAFCTIIDENFGNSNKNLISNLKNMLDSYIDEKLNSMGIINNTFVAKNSEDLIKFHRIIMNYHFKFLTLNLTNGVTYNMEHSGRVNPLGTSLPADLLIDLKNVENFRLNGNGATITTNENCITPFIKAYQVGNCFIYNLTINNFGNAIINDRGYFIAYNVNFTAGKCPLTSFVISRGYSIFLNCVFHNGQSEYGGAIYNDEGVLLCQGCFFKMDTNHDSHCSEGGFIYNNKGYLISNNCTFENGNAKYAGAIYNYYGEAIINQDIFINSHADKKGGAIYSDFSKLIVNNSNFINSTCSNGPDIYSYGEDGGEYIVNQSYTFNGNEGKSIKVTDSKPSKALRWTLRILEIVGCVALCLICTFTGMPELAAGVVGLVGGAGLAAAEEYIEEKYLDHNVNTKNILVMAAIAGAFDAVSDALGTAIGHIFTRAAAAAAGIAVEEVVLSAGKQALLAGICFAIELTSEILTEFIPRVDFNSEYEINSDNLSSYTKYGLTNSNIISQKINMLQNEVKSKTGILKDNINALMDINPISNGHPLNVTKSIDNIIYQIRDLVMNLQKSLPFSGTPKFIKNAMDELSKIDLENKNSELNINSLNDICNKLSGVLNNISNSMSKFYSLFDIVYEKGAIAVYSK